VRRFVCVPRAYDVQYLDDGKTELDVPASELRLASEKDRVDRQLPPAGGSTNPLALNVKSIAVDGFEEGGEVIVKTPRAIVHRRGGIEHDEDSDVLVIEGQQEHLATGGGVRGIRFLKNSTRA